MAYFNFQRLITKYSRPFTLISKGEKTLKFGEWVYEEPTEFTLYGAIIGFSENKIHRSEGTLTAKDKMLHTLELIDNSLMGATIIFNGEKYTIETQKGKDNADFTGCYSYLLKWVSAFEEGKND